MVQRVYGVDMVQRVDTVGGQVHNTLFTIPQT